MINTPITNEQTAKHCIHKDGTFYCKSTCDCCECCWYNSKACSNGKLKDEDENDT